MEQVREVHDVPLFVYELAHRCRVTLEDKSVRKRVVDTVQDTLVDQDAGGVTPTTAGDWPFPVECGVEESPGCILALAALNDFAATHQRPFEKEDCNFTELRPLQDNSALEVITYGMQWVLAVRKFEDKHGQRLCLVVESALRELGVPEDEQDAAHEGTFVSVDDIPAEDRSCLHPNSLIAQLHSGEKQTNPSQYVNRAVKKKTLRATGGKGNSSRYVDVTLGFSDAGIKILKRPPRSLGESSVFN